jgi:3-dehydroquinate synthase
MDHAFRAEAGMFAENFPNFRLAFTEQQGEAAKSFAEAQRIFELMAAEKYHRDDFMIVRGGGSLTDLGAFCAGLYKRGLKLILVPTTLLAAVDAAVGGKTAINFGGAKNQIGHFYLPSNVVVDAAAFKTLPRERINEGLVEAYKTGLLFDRELVRLAEEEDCEAHLAEVATRSYQAKAALVAQDFREEKGIRDVLNLGHTYGHVVESFYGSAKNRDMSQKEAPEGLSHGRAVAVGLAVAAELSRAQLGDIKAKNIIETSRRLGGGFPKMPPLEAARALLQADKKIRGGKLRFVLLDDFEKPRLAEIEADEVLEAARKLETGTV